jgi:VWFA-related protein
MHRRLLVIACWAGAQKTEPDEVQVSSRPYPPPANLPIFSANTRLVDVGVVVRDENGRAMGGLKQADFQVFEDGKRRRITVFGTIASGPDPGGHKPAPQTSPPGVPLPATRPAAAAPLRSMALLFDDIHTRPEDLAAAKLAARQFLASVAPGDRIALFTTFSTQTLDFTSDRDKVLATVAKVEAHPLGSEKGTQACSEIRPYQAYLMANDLDEVGTGAEKWRAVHFRFDYADSNFGLLLPAAIHIEMYTPEMRDGVIVRSPMTARLAQTYGPFSRFEVHVEQKAAMRAESH